MAILFKQPKEQTEVAPISTSPDLWASDYVVEIKYQPNPRVLDHRGKWANLLTSHMEVTEWMIDTNRIDVFSKDEKARFFVAFRNAGLSLKDSSSPSYARSQADKFMRWLFRQSEFGSPLHVERMGVRFRFGARFDGTFDELKDRIATRYFEISDRTRTAIGEGAKLVDLAAVLNWEDELSTFNTNLGPMTKEELAAQFQRGEENPPPEVGLYYDIDYFRKPNRDLLAPEITSSISKFTTAASERYQRIRDLIFE